MTPDTGPDIPMETVRIEADPEGVLPARFWDAYSLFEEATAAFDDKRYDEAYALYSRVPKEFPESDLASTARYNAALTLERLDRFADAAAIYRDLRASGGPDLDPGDLILREGHCAEESGQFARAAALYSRDAARTKLTPVQAAEIQVRYGIVQFRQGRETESLRTLRAATVELKRLVRAPVRLAGRSLGEGYFTMGEIYQARFDAVSLQVPDDEQSRALDEKAELLLLARAQYVKAIRCYVSEWMTAALCRIGDGYEAFYRAVLAAPLPGNLLASETDAYVRKLKSKMQPVLRKAIAAHKRNLKLAADNGVDNKWIARSRKRINVLEQLDG